MSKETGIPPAAEPSKAEILHEQLAKRAPIRESKYATFEKKAPSIVRPAIRNVGEALDLYRPPNGSDQMEIPLGFQRQQVFDHIVTRGIIAFAHPHIVETRQDRDIVTEAKEHIAEGNNLIVMCNHLSHADGPEITKVLEMQGIKGVTSVLGLRIIRNPVARRMMQGVPMLTVYPESEQFWRTDAYKEIEPTLNDEERDLVKRERLLARRMHVGAAEAIKDVFAKNHPLLIFPEGSRHPNEGMQEPVPGAAGVIKRGNNPKILVMSLMGTEKMLPKSEGKKAKKVERSLIQSLKPSVLFEKYKGPRPHEVKVRFSDLLDPVVIEAAYRKDHPEAKTEEINDNLLTEVMKTMAKGLDPEYRGIYAPEVNQANEPFKFVVQEIPSPAYREAIKRHLPQFPKNIYK